MPGVMPLHHVTEGPLLAFSVTSGPASVLPPLLPNEPLICARSFKWRVLRKIEGC